MRTHTLRLTYTFVNVYACTLNTSIRSFGRSDRLGIEKSHLGIITSGEIQGEINAGIQRNANTNIK